MQTADSEQTKARWVLSSSHLAQALPTFGLINIKLAVMTKLFWADGLLKPAWNLKLGSSGLTYFLK